VSSTTAEEVDRLLEHIGNGQEITAMAQKLYAMGPQINPFLLEQLNEMDITKYEYSSKVYSTIMTILSSRGYDKDILEILKSKLSDDDPQKRISAAVILAIYYHYSPVRELASIVSGEKKPSYLTEQSMYEWSSRSAEIVSQILEVLRGGPEISKQFVVSTLKECGIDCPECGYEAEKWESFFKTADENGTPYVYYLGSDWFEDRPLSGSEVTGIRGLTPSPDGKKLALCWGSVSEGKFDTDLWILDTTSNKLTKVQIPGSCYRPAWSPRGDLIAFQNITARGFNICTIKDDGSDLSVWTKSFNAFNQSPQWSPDTGKIGFIRHYALPSALEIQVIDLAQNKIIAVAKDNFCESLTSRNHPIWHFSKGSRVYYWDCFGDDKQTEGLYRTTIEASGRSELVLRFELDPTFNSLILSPNEDKLAYTKDECLLGVYDLSSGERREFEVGSMGSYPVWTLDGEDIVYGTSECEIYTFSLETKKITKLAEGGFTREGLNGAGEFIYYTKRNKLTKEWTIWRINLDGTGKTKIFPMKGIESVSVQAVPTLKWAESK